MPEWLPSACVGTWEGEGVGREVGYLKYLAWSQRDEPATPHEAIERHTHTCTRNLLAPLSLVDNTMKHAHRVGLHLSGSIALTTYIHTHTRARARAHTHTDGCSREGAFFLP